LICAPRRSSSLHDHVYKLKNSTKRREKNTEISFKSVSGKQTKKQTNRETERPTGGKRILVYLLNEFDV